nr:G-protein coupled receptor Mth2-like isoform X1 [Lepeophtheirus salmonis]
MALNFSSPTYCFGTSIKKNSISDLSTPSSFMRSELFYCQAYPCDGATPCVSTCCNPGEILLKENHTCISPDWNNITTFLDLEENHAQFSNMFHFRTRQNGGVVNFEKRTLSPCKEGYESVILSKCYQSFYLESSKENGTYLTIDIDGSNHYVNEYCVYITEEKKFMGNVCREVIGKAKFNFFRYYPIILIGSAFFLFLTILIYSVYGKKLLNHYTRLMRHFTVGLFVAFTVLSFNQLFAFMSISLLICQIVGYIQQFSFLVSFTFMTLMSSEIFMKMKSLTSTNSQKRFTIQRLIGYGVPLIITVITITVELTAPECSKFKPRFGEKQCFFAGKEAIFLYFNIPILIMLLINTIMFFGTVMTILKVQRAAKSYFKNQRESLDRFALFMKLFLGMGIIWIFEILAKGTSGIVPQEVWYFTDILNMLQGFYVFLIFVCKRNVIEVILKKDSKLGSSVKTGENNQSDGSHWLKLRNRQKSSMGTSHTNLDTIDSVK